MPIFQNRMFPLEPRSGMTTRPNKVFRETIAMKTRFRSEADGWTADGRKINSPEALEVIQRCLDKEGSVIIEHWFYRGSSAPNRAVFDDFEELMAYLNEHAYAGDSIYVWSFSAVCLDDNTLASGKCPDEDGLVPLRGAY